MKEEWRTCVGWPVYEVSNHGCVRRIGSLELIGCWFKEGYVYVDFSHHGKRGKLHVAELVLKAFSSSRPPGTQIRHLNDVKHDNRHGNLRWGTGVQNYADSVRNGIQGYGERNGKAKLTQAAVDDIRMSMLLPIDRRRAQKITLRSLAAKYGVTKNAVHQVMTGRTWKRT